MINKKKALIIDANSIFHRAYHATINQLNRNTNKWESILPWFAQNKIKPNNATKLCLLWLLSIISKNEYDYFVACWDSGLVTKRTLIDENYKANRTHMNEEMRVQIEDVKEIVSILGGVNINIEGVEADDIGGTLNKIFNKKNVSVELYSSDKDWMQLIDEDTKLILIKNGGEKNWLTLTKENFSTLSGYPFQPSSIIDFKILYGDDSDNYKGPLGEKTAIDLITKYGKIENIIANINELKGNVKNKIESFFNSKDIIDKSYMMARIFDDIEIDHDIAKYKKNQICYILLYSFIKNFSFTGFEKYKIDQKTSLVNKIIFFQQDIEKKEDETLYIQTGNIRNEKNKEWKGEKYDNVMRKWWKILYINNSTILLTDIWNFDNTIFNNLNVNEKDDINQIKKELIEKYNPNIVVCGNCLENKVQQDKDKAIVFLKPENFAVYTKEGDNFSFSIF